jgi:integrase
VTAVEFLVSRLYDACFIVVAYLVGARVSEILGLKIGGLRGIEWAIFRAG